MLHSYVRYVVRHRVGVLAVVLLITAALGSQLAYLRLEINRRAQLPQGHPYVIIQNKITEIFGGEAIVVIGVVANQGTIFDANILGKVHRITEALRDSPGAIESSLFGLAAPHVKAVTATKDNGADVRPLMPEPPTSADEVRQIRELVNADPLFRGNLVSSDETATVIVAEFDDSLTDAQIGKNIAAIVDVERDASVHIALAGAPILRVALAEYTRMMSILFPLAVLVIGLVHYEAFRTLQAMVLPLVTALLSVVWALGILGLTRQPMDTWSAITPVVILVVAAGHAVQILKRYYEEFAICGDNREAVVRSAVAVTPVMLTAGLIATAGFASLVTFDVASVRTFGLLLASGIFSALVIEMTFTPACRAILPPPTRIEVLRERDNGWLDRLLDRVADIVLNRPWRVLAVSAVLVSVISVGMVWLRVDNSFRLWFSPTTALRKDDALLNQKLAGVASLRVLVEARGDTQLTDPNVLRAVDELQHYMGEDPTVGGITSIVDHLKRVNKAMHDGDPAFYRIPDTQRQVDHYLFLYGMSSGPDGLSSLIDDDRHALVIRGLSKTDTSEFSRAYLDRLQAYCDKRFAGLPVDVRIAGGTLGVQTALNDVIVHEKITNMAQVSTIIFVLSAIVLHSLVGGLMVLGPLLLAAMVTLGLMGWTQTWLDMATAAFTAMGVSIGADFAIYLLFRVREEMSRVASLEEAVRQALQTSGKAIFFVSSAVGLGYLVLPFAGFSLWTRLGILTTTLIVASAAATLTVVPAVILTLRPRFLSLPNQTPTSMQSPDMPQHHDDPLRRAL